MNSDIAILLTYLFRDEPYNEAELLVVYHAAQKVGVKLPKKWEWMLRDILPAKSREPGSEAAHITN